jgi:hypothetical protein
MRRGISLVAVLLLAVFWSPASSGAVTLGAPLGLSANVAGSCQEFVLYGVPPSCTMFGFDGNGAWTSQTPRGRWTITRARVRTGPSVGPMVFTVLRVLRSQAGSPASGAICCTVPVESQVFTPAPNAVNEVPVNLPVVNTVENIDGEPVEVVDYLGISLLDLSSSLPLHAATSSADPGASATLSYFIPALRRGGQGLQAGARTGLTPLIAADYQQVSAAPTGPAGPAPAPVPVPAPTTPGIPVTPQPPPTGAPAPFRLLSGVDLLRGGTRARLGVEAPGPGLLRALPKTGGARRIALGREGRRGKRGKRRPPRLLVPARRRVKKAGRTHLTLKLTAVGRHRLARRGKLKIPVKVTFTPVGGEPTSRVRKVVFKRQRKGRDRSGPVRGR